MYYFRSQFSSLISNARNDNEDVYQLEKLLQNRRSRSGRNYYNRMPRDSFQNKDFVKSKPAMPTFDISFEDWLADSGESIITKNEFSYPKWHFHRRKRLLNMKEPDNPSEKQLFWTKLKESVKKLRKSKKKKKEIPKNYNREVFQTAQNMIHSLLLG